MICSMLRARSPGPEVPEPKLSLWKYFDNALIQTAVWSQQRQHRQTDRRLQWSVLVGCGFLLANLVGARYPPGPRQHRQVMEGHVLEESLDQEVEPPLAVAA
eukprot:scaffold296109_cov29-Prasinocladus_malaysianus.AAC.1